MLRCDHIPSQIDDVKELEVDEVTQPSKHLEAEMVIV
jgi:hypothetical protein